MNNTSEEAVRAERLASLAAQGVNAYPAEVNRTHEIAAALDHFDALQASQAPITVVGRAKAMRHIGAMTFVRIEDGTGSMQLMLRKDDMGDAYSQFVDHADVGDFFECTGKAYVTKTGEKSVYAESIRFISKALRPLPEKFHGLQDVETRYRQRELDLISNPEIRQRFIARSKLVSSIRRFLDDRGFLEVETPMLQLIPGGANARPFITHHNALDTDLYLRIAPELYLKRLIVGGFEKVYEIGRCFRNEGIDYAHNPEFSMLEFYWAYANKDAFVDFMEELMVHAITEATGGTIVPTSEGGTIDFKAPWPRMTFREAILNETGIDIDTLKSAEDVEGAAKMKKLEIDFSSCVGLGDYFDELWKKTARPKIVSPTWIFDYPAELKPLSKASQEDASKSASVQLVVQGAEIVNAYYYEMNNPLEQRANFEAQQALREQGSEEAQWMDGDFLRSLEHGMPPTSGMGMGIDRLAAFISGAPNLKEAILFPTLRPKKDGDV